MVTFLVEPQLDSGVAIISQEAAGFLEIQVTEAAGGCGNIHAESSL
jgi:hypothetical protein